MLDVNKLKGAIARAGHTQNSLSKELKMSINTLNAKVNGKSSLTCDEVVTLCDVLGIESESEKVEIFLA